MDSILQSRGLDELPHIPALNLKKSGLCET